MPKAVTESPPHDDNPPISTEEVNQSVCPAETLSAPVYQLTEEQIIEGEKARIRAMLSFRMAQIAMELKGDEYDIARLVFVMDEDKTLVKQAMRLFKQILHPDKGGDERLFKMLADMT